MRDLMAGVYRPSHGIIWGPVVVSDNHRVYGKKGMNTPHARATRARADQFTHILQAGSIPRMMGKREIAMKLLSALAVGLLFAGPVSAQDFETAQAIAQSGDYETAAKILKQLAEQGDAEAQMTLGLLYLKGVGVLQDDDEGMRLLRLSASQAYPMAFGVLGNVYEDGIGAQQDNVTAHMWYNIFTVTNDDKSLDDKARKDRDDIAKKMTHDQIVEAQRRALFCLKTNYQDCE